MVLALLGSVAAACGSSSSNSSASGNSANAAANAGEHNILPPVATGNPILGGTLKIVGAGDVDHLDTCCAYYTVTYELMRAVTRQLVSYASTTANPNPTQIVPDIATYTIGDNGLLYTFKIKQGVEWDTPTGARQVTSYDEELGLKRLCNPVQAAPPIAYWEDNIAGMKSFCSGFQTISLKGGQAAEIATIKNYIDNHQISGLSTPSSDTIEIKLLHPASSFLNIMAMPMSSPVPVEALKYLPASVQEEEHFISDGPYAITSYTPAVSYNLVKNPYWKESTDSLRHQYVNGITVTMGQNATTIQQELETGDADLEWDTTVPAASVEGLIAAKNPQFLTVFVGGITYLAFNMKSTTANNALQKVAVRKALQYCVSKRHIIQVSGGPQLNVASNQVLPPQITGFKKLNPYPTTNDEGDPSKCKSMLASAGYPHGLTLTLIYANNPPNPAQAQALQSDFAAGGVTLKLLEQPQQGEYFTYIQTPSNKKNWDIAFGLWFPDWQGNAAQTFFSPLFDGRLYGIGSTNYGDYNDTTVNNGIDKALSTASVSAASDEWASVDNYETSQNPGWIPLLYDALPNFIGKNVDNAIYNGFLGYVDITQVWLKNG
jgi:peptide/nickel transport system substrate-binding protein